VHADRNVSGAFATRIPGRSKFRKSDLKCSGLKQKMNSRGRRSSVRVAIRIASCRSASFVCWVKPVHRTTNFPRSRPRLARAAARSASVGGVNRETSIPQRMRRMRPDGKPSSSRRRRYASENGTTTAKLEKLANNMASYRGRLRWYVGAESVSGTLRLIARSSTVAGPKLSAK